MTDRVVGGWPGRAEPDRNITESTVATVIWTIWKSIGLDATLLINSIVVALKKKPKSMVICFLSERSSAGATEKIFRIYYKYVEPLTKQRAAERITRKTGTHQSNRNIWQDRRTDQLKNPLMLIDTTSNIVFLFFLVNLTWTLIIIIIIQLLYIF